MIHHKELAELRIMRQQWLHHSSKLRKRAGECVGATDFYHEAANCLGEARQLLDWAILEESAVQE